MAENVSPRPLGQTLFGVARSVARFVDKEAEYARREAVQKVTVAGKDAALIAAGGAIAYGGLLAILVGIIQALAAVLPRWLASLLVGALAAGAGGVLVQRGIQGLRGESPLPNRTVATAQAGFRAGAEEWSRG
jgi:hypothetical protein